MALTISQALRTFEEFRPKPDRAADSITAEAVSEMLRVAIENLKSEVATLKRELHSTRAADRKDFERLIDQCAVHAWLSKSFDEMLAPLSQQGGDLSRAISGLARFEAHGDRAVGGRR